MSLISLPRELRENTYSSLGRPATEPANFPMIMATVVVDDQPFPINSALTNHDIVSNSGKAIHESCRQIHAEYSQLLRRAAFLPGTKSILPVYNFDFCQMISFVKTLKPHEIIAATRNRSLMINLFLFSKALEAQRVLQWVQLCEKVGLQVSYVLQWTAHDVNHLKEIDAVIGGYREGKKIVKALSASSVLNWNWATHTSNLKQRD